MSSALEYFMNYDSIPLSKRIGTTNVKDQTSRNMNKGGDTIELQGRNINWRTGINTPDPETGLTPLMVAAIQGKKDILAALLERGAEVDYVEVRKGRSALHLACYSGHADCVQELLKRGAVVNNQVRPIDINDEQRCNCYLLFLPPSIFPEFLDRIITTRRH